MVKLSKAYCCEHLPCFPDTRSIVTATWNRCFGRRRWATLTEVVKACNRFARGRAEMWAYDLLREVLGEELFASDLLSAYRREPRIRGSWCAVDLRWARKIDAEWEGTLDYC